MTRLVALALVLAAAACGPESGTGLIALALETGPLDGPTAEPGSPMADESGLADLSRFPLFLVVRVEADDLAGPVVASWPETVPAEVPAEVALELEVPPGPGRRVSVELLLVERPEAPGTFVAPAPGAPPTTASVESGRVAEVEIELHELPVATVRATLPAGFGAAAVSWVDDRLGAALPPAPVEDGAAEVALAVGRTYWPRVVLEGESRDLPAQSVRPAVAGQILEVALEP